LRVLSPVIIEQGNEGFVLHFAGGLGRGRIRAAAHAFFGFLRRAVYGLRSVAVPI
jgi:hypothetical protein